MNISQHTIVTFNADAEWQNSIALWLHKTAQVSKKVNYSKLFNVSHVKNVNYGFLVKEQKDTC